MQRSALNSFAFTWLHPIIGYCMLLVTVAAARIYYMIHMDHSRVPEDYRALLAYACSSVVATLTFTRLLHKGIARGIFATHD